MLAEDNIFSDKDIAQITNDVQSLLTWIRRFRVDEVLVFGTSALRAAYNSGCVRDEIFKVCGVVVDILSVREELSCVFHAVKTQYALAPCTLICDIGGGSSEFFITNTKRILWQISIPHGISSFRAGVSSSRVYARLFQELKRYRVQACYGTSGMFRVMASWCAGKADLRESAAQEPACVPRTYVHTLSAQQKGRTVLHAIVHAGAQAFIGIMDAARIDTVCVSMVSTREGYLLQKKGNEENIWMH